MLQFWDIEMLGSIRICCRSTDGLFIHQQPRLSHTYGDYADMGNAEAVRGEFRNGASNFIVARLRLLLVRIAMDEQNIAREDFRGYLDALRHCALLPDLGFWEEFTTYCIGPVGFAYQPIENGQKRAVSWPFGEECELNMPHPLRQFEKYLLRLIAVDESQFLG